MKSILKFLFVVIILLGCLSAALLSPPWAFAQKENATEGAVPVSGGNQLVSIDFNNVDIGVFIKFISDLTKKNFVVNERVRGKVTIISPGKITVDEAFRVFESVLEVHGYTAVPSGEIIKIVPSPDARSKSIKTRLEEEAGFVGDGVVTQIIPLRYADPNEIKRLFTPLVSKNSVILSYPPTNTLIVTDVHSNIKRLLRILKAIDITGVGQQIAIIPVEYADATKLVTLLNSVFKAPKKGKASTQKEITFVADERTNVIVVLASEADANSIRRLVKSLDKETPRAQAKIHVYYLEHAPAEELAKVLMDIPQKDGADPKKGGKPTAPVVSEKVRITADKATNSLIIMADMEDYLILESIIRKIDIPRAMVYIEALIMEVNVDKDFRLGTEWMIGGETTYKDKNMIYGGGFSGGATGGDPGYSAIGGGGVNPVTGEPVALLPPGFALGLFGEALTISGVTFPSIAAVVQAYKKDRDVRILSTPQILTTDNQEAKIYVGKNIPFQTTATASSIGNQVYNSFEYRDVGKTLKITPQISKDRMVRLELSLEVTALESDVDNRPTTLKRTVDTTTIVKDRNTVVLGGLIDDVEGIVDYKVPCLGDIPGFGLLFRSKANATEQTNLYIFLTPRVIQNPGEAENVYSHKRNEIENIREESINLYPSNDDDSPAPQDQKEPSSDSQGNDQDKKPGTSGTAPSEASSAEPVKMAAIANPETLSPQWSADSASVQNDTTIGDGLASVPLQTASARQGMQQGTGEPLSSPATRPENETQPTPLQRNESSDTAASVQGYTVQVASVQSAQMADQMLQELTAKGFAAYTVRSEISGKTWYRLRIGYFDSRAAAEPTMTQLRGHQYNPILIKL